MRPILVSGAHRTGTTWVGRLLAAAPGVAYISEPLNVLHRPGVFRASVPHWYSYICRDNEQAFLSSFRELLSFRYHLGAELKAIRSLRDLLRMGRDLAIFTGGRAGRRIPLLKDPFALFSLPWFAERLDCRIVVTVRHPAAFASGLKRLSWSFDFENLLRQPLLMRDHLKPYEKAMRSDAARDVVGQAGLLWAILYGYLQELRTKDPSLLVVRHEDLALDPVEGFKRLYDRLGLQFTARARRAVVDSSSAANPMELSKQRVHSVRMDSRGSLQNWRRRLSAGEIERIRRLTDGVVQRYYPEESWN